MPGGPFPFDDSASSPVARLLLLLLLGGCALSRSPQTLAERTADTRQRLSAPATPAARRDAAIQLLAGAGLSPVAGLRGPAARYAAGRLIGGFVPGRSYGLRDTLVVVAAALDGPYAATLVETSRLLTARADSQGDWPQRSILVVLWDAGLSVEDGLAAVRAFPLWPRGAVRETVVVSADSAMDGGRPGRADVRFALGTLDDDATVRGIVETLYTATVAP